MDAEVLKYMSKVRDYYIGKTKLTTEEVVDILLGQDKSINNEKSINVNNESEFNGFDMQELLKWKNKNNDKYEIKSCFPITSHRKVIGSFLINGKKILRRLLTWYINPIVEQQNEFNGSVTASINSLYNNELITQEFISKILTNKEIISELQDKNELLLKKIEKILSDNRAMNNKVEKLEGIIEQYNTKLEDINNKSDELSNKSDELSNKLEKINEESDYIKFKLYSIEKKKNENMLDDKNTTIYIENKAGDKKLEFNQYGIDYFEFENRFRGSCNNIKSKQKVYLEYFKERNKILDIGCGRGEFLELLEENNIKAEGIDVCKAFVEYCEYKNLKVKLVDAVSYLNEIDNNSIGGVFMSQVAEHLEIEYLIELVTKVYNKLEKGSYFIAETPNPTMLSTFSNAFYLDPSHKNPVHPETFRFILEHAGFKEINIVFTKQSKIEYKLPLLNGENISNLEEFNDGINLLSNLLFGSQDYAIIARK